MDHALISNTETMELVTLLMSKVEAFITENSYLKDENRDIKEHLLKSEYHEYCNSLLFDGYDEQK